MVCPPKRGLAVEGELDADTDAIRSVDISTMPSDRRVDSNISTGKSWAVGAGSTKIRRLGAPKKVRHEVHTDTA